MNNESKGYTELGQMSFHGGSQKDKKNDNIKYKEWVFKIGILAIALVLIILVIIILIKLSGNQEVKREINQEVDEKLTDGNENGSKYARVAEDLCENVFAFTIMGEKINVKNLKKQYPKFMGDFIDELFVIYDMALKMNKDEWQELVKEANEVSVKLKFESTDKERIEKDELKEYQEDIESFAGADKNVEVTCGYCVTIKLIADSDTKLDEENINFIVLECNGKIGVWGIEDPNTGDRFFLWDMWDM